MKTKQILTLFAALMVSVLLTAQTNLQRQDVAKENPVKVKLEMMKYAIFANPFISINSEDPGDLANRCMKKQQVAEDINEHPVLREYCYPIDRRRPKPNPDMPYEQLQFPARSDGGR